MYERTGNGFNEKVYFGIAESGLSICSMIIGFTDQRIDKDETFGLDLQF